MPFAINNNLNDDYIMVTIPLHKAKFCVECNSVFRETKDGKCPACGSFSTYYLQNWIKK